MKINTKAISRSLVLLLVTCLMASFSVTPTYAYSGKAVETLEDGTIYRPTVALPDEGKIGGVCAGIAYKLGIDPVIPRIGFIVFTLMGGAGVLAYFICWWLMDDAPTPQDYKERIYGK